MSLVLCQHCGGWIDTDDDPEAYRGEKHGQDIWVCEKCRDNEGNDNANE